MATGEVEITLNGRKEVLRCSPRAARAVNGLGSFATAFQRIGAFDFDAYVTVMAAGLGKKPSDIEDAVYQNGMPDLVEPLSEFVSLLMNGGRPRAPAEPAPSGE